MADREDDSVEAPFRPDEVRVQQIVNHIGLVITIKSRAINLKQHVKFFRRGITDFDLIRNSAKKRFVDQIARFKIGREYDQLLKRDFNFLSRPQRQEINTAFQRDNPTIEQFLRFHSLTTEIVYQQAPAELGEVRPDFLKFDMKLTKNIEHAPAKRQEVMALFAILVNNLGIQTRAEGVETRQCHEILVQMGFQLG